MAPQLESCWHFARGRLHRESPAIRESLLEGLNKLRIKQIAQRAIDIERAKQFYIDHFGAVEIATFDPPGLAFLDVSGLRLLLSTQSSPSTFYLDVPDVHDTVATLRSQGVEITTEPHVIFHDATGQFGSPGDDEWMAFFRDSEGNDVGSISRTRPQV